MKRLLVLFVLFFTVLFTYTVLAQEAGSVRKNYKLTIPEKIHKLVLDPLPAGTYSIGTGGYFPTIDSAFNKLSIDGIAGEVILELIDNLYTAPAGLYGYVLNGPIPGASAASRVTLRPADNHDVTIQGDGEAVLVFNDVSYLTIDGSTNLQGATRLKVHAFYNNQGTQWNDAVDFYGNCDYIQVKNLTASSDDINRYSAAIFFSQNNQSAPDSGLVSGVFIPVANAGIYLLGDGTYNPTGFVISNNHMGSPNDSLSSWGIQNQTADGTIIENNHIENMRKGNFFYGLYFIYGIQSFYSDNVIIRNNIIHNIAATNGPTRLQGIFVSGDAGQRGSNNWIYNNMVYDIRTYVSNVEWLAGIFVGDHDSPRIDYNSVSLSEVGDAAPNSGSAPLWIHPSVTTPSVRNNILINTRNDEPRTAVAVRYHVVGVSDYNDLYVGSFDHSYIAYRSGTFYKTLPEWQATGKDLHSVNEMPNFVSPYLHIDASIATNLEKRAIPIAGIYHDFDDESRDVNLPDIGADEFNGIIPTGALASGTYSVGTTGYFTTIQNAFDKLHNDGIAGAVTFELSDELYTAPADTFGFLLDGPITGAGPNSRITIKPAENKNVTVEGNWRFVVTFRNVSYLTLDGISTEGPTTLTIHSLYNAQYVTNRGVGFLSNSDHNAVQNLIIICDDYLREGPGIFFQAADNSIFAADSNLIQNNLIKKAGCAIYVSSWAGNQNTRVIGNIIRGNKIGSETDSLIAWGIQLEKSQNAIVENNIVQNLKLNNGYVWENMNIGINSYQGNGDIIRNNVVHNIQASGGYTGVGILLSGEGSRYGNNNLIYNNMVYDIQSTSTQSDSRVAGIQVWMQQSPKIYYNSVFLSGTGANQQGSGALYIWETCTNVEAKNNILVNTRDESPYCASAIYIQYSPSILTSDYNDLFYAQSQYNYLVKTTSGNYLTLAEWQATGKDLHGINEMPNFIAPDNLHINTLIATYIESGGTPITGITEDFDGDLRNVSKSDIGADEIDGIVLPVELTTFTAEAFDRKVILKWTTATELNNNGFEIQRRVAESDFATVGFVKGEGTTTNQKEYSYIDKELADGKYFYRLKQIDYNGTYEYSNVIEVDVRSLNEYALEQNYPNPFNPVTTIGYVLKEKSNAKLTLLNAIGEEVEVLVNEEQDKGFHKIDFSASNLPSGVYFYQLKAGEYVSTKKMILLK